MRSKLTNEIQGQSQLQSISKITNRLETSAVVKSQQLDYTNTRFHNALIVRHDVQQAFQEEVEKGAFEKAKDATTEKHKEKAQKENLNRENEMKARERGQKALNTHLAKKDKEIFEKEMKKVA